MAVDDLYILTKDDGVQFIVRAECPADHHATDAKDILIAVEEVTTHQGLIVPVSQLRLLDGRNGPPVNRYS